MNWPAFANPWMLAGLAAVGLPVLIHFLTRARPRRIAFPPFQFLLEACAGQQSVHRLRTILLLAIRCLAVLALVLLFSRPFLKPAGAALGAEAAKRVVLIIDASLSMRAVQQGVPLFARAQAEAADILRGLDSGSEAAVILEGATPRPLLPALSRNIPALHEELVKTQATYENGDPGAALALAAKMLGGAGTIYVFSDFQKSNWQGVPELPGGVVCRLRPVTQQAVDNVAITAAHLSPSEPVMGEPLEITGAILNCTPRPREETVRLELGEFTRETRVKVPAFGTTEAAFNISVPHPGSFAAKLSLEPDDLIEDNTRWLLVHVSQALRILLVSDADESDPQSAAFYISRALVPSPEAAPGLTLIRRRTQDADRGVLETSDVFVLVAPALPSQEALDIMARRVKEGAHLMVFLDGPTAPDLASPALDPPFHLRHTVNSETGDAVAAGHAKLFADTEAEDLGALRFRRHYQVELVESRRDEVLLSYPDGSPALTLGAMGQGSAVFANLPFTPDGSDFIGSPMFPAMIHELLRKLRRASDEQAVTPGSAWVLNVASAGETAVTVTDPQGHPFAAQVMASGRTTRLALPSAQLPGAYPIKQGETIVSYGIVNVDPRESDTRPIALESLKAGGRSTVTVAQDEEDLLLAGKTRQLWPLLAGAAAALLGLEMLLLAFWRRPLRTSRGSLPGKMAARERNLEAVR
ncbi:MAG: BatA domain-containing protein [Verrucomicrobiota bacterium]|jgi:hypothetical protein